MNHLHKLGGRAMKQFMMLIVMGYLTLLLQAQAQSNSVGYTKYCNSRYTFCLQHPRYLQRDEAPANNDGRRFYDDMGLSVSAYGSYNALFYSLRDQMLEDSKDFDRVTYQTIKNDWYVLSGYKGKNIIYKKTYLRGEIFYHLYIIYPYQLNEHYKDIVSNISKSFQVDQERGRR